MFRRQTWMVAFFVSVTPFAGCGSANQAERPSTVGAAPSETSSSSPAQVRDDAEGPSPIVSTVTDGVAAPAEPAAVTPQVVAPAAATAEQIARWASAPFEPLELLANLEWEKTSFTSRLAAVGDGQHFLVAGSRVLLWNIAEDKPEHVFLELTAADGDRTILSLAVAPDQSWFATGDSNGMVRLWRLDDRREIASKQLDSNAVTHLAISPDGQEIASIAYTGEVSTWDARTLDPRRKFRVSDGALNRVEYVSNGQLAAAGETTSLWNTSTGEKISDLPPGRYSFALARSPDDAVFIFGGDDKLSLWNVAQAKVEAEITSGVSGGELIAFSQDGKLLATTNGSDVRIWNLAERRAVQIIDGYGYAVVGLAWLPESNLLAVAADIGGTRVWGTREQAAAVGLKPLNAALAMPQATSAEPANTSQLEEVIDLRTFPRPSGCEPSMVSRHYFDCLAAMSADEAKTYYHHFLTRSGWTVVEKPSNDSTSVDYLKSGFMLTLSCVDGGDGKTNIMLTHHGDYDARLTPRFDAAPIEPLYEMPTSLAYNTRADLLTIESNLLRTLRAAGWIPYTRLHSSHGDEIDSRDWSFLRGGYELRVSAGKFPVFPDGYTIQYTLFIHNASAPAPPDATYIEFDGSTEPALLAISQLSLEELRRFYDDTMAAQGWLVREHGRSLKEDHAWLPYLRGQRDLTVGLSKLEDGRTLVRVGDTNGSLWDATQAEEEPATATSGAGLEAADLPILNATKTAKFDKLQQTVELMIEDVTLAEAAKRYTEALSELGWTVEEGGIQSEDYTLLSFAKQDQELTLRARLMNGDAIISFAGDALLWNKEPPSGAQIISYETWLWQNKRPPSLEWLDAYETEMREILAGKPANGD